MAAPTPDQYARVRYLYESLTPKPPELLRPGRYYVREGAVLVWDENRRKKSKRYIFLLNDALLITKRDGSRKFWLRVFISLASPNVAVENMTSGFDHAFRVQVTPRPRPEDFSGPQRRSFVFFTNDDVEAWIDDVQRAVKGANDIEEAPKANSSFNSGFSSSLHQTPSSSSTSYSTTTTKSKHSQRDFASFTDGDFVDTKVTFDSGMKLGGIRKDNGGFDDASALPMLAPPPARSGGSAPVQNFAPAPTAQQPTSNSIPSLEDFLSLPSTTSAAPSASANGGIAPSPFAGGNFATAPSAPAASNSTYNPFGGAAPAQPAANTSAAYMSAFYGSQPQAQNNPFAPAPQTYNFGAAPTMQQPTAAPNTGYYGGFSAQPMQSTQPAADPFASFGAPPTAQPVQPSAQPNKPVDFFF